MTRSGFPPGWDEDRVQEVLAYYEEQADDAVVAEDEAAFYGVSDNVSTAEELPEYE